MVLQYKSLEIRKQIERASSNSLGYKPIREPSQGVESELDLQAHLARMDARVAEFSGDKTSSRSLKTYAERLDKLSEAGIGVILDLYKKEAEAQREEMLSYLAQTNSHIQRLESALEKANIEVPTARELFEEALSHKYRVLNPNEVIEFVNLKRKKFGIKYEPHLSSPSKF